MSLAFGHEFEPEHLALLIEALPVGVYILNGAGKAIYSNSAAETLLGQGVTGEGTEGLARRYSVFVAGTDQLYPNELLPVVRALNGERVQVDDVEVERDGKRTALEVTATPIYDAAGTVTFAVAVFQDITERRDAQRALAAANAGLERQVELRTAELALTIDALEREIARRKVYEAELLLATAAAERASRSKSTFMMNISHELRTPLNHIIGFSELLADRADNERSRKLASTTTTSGRDLLEKIDHLIELARIEAQDGGERQRLALPALIEVMEHCAAIAGSDMRFSFENGSAGSVEVDLAALQRALATLFERCGGQAVVEARDGDASVTISIPDSELATRIRSVEQVFGESTPAEGQRFQQQLIDLPLAVARAQVRTMGGDIVTTATQGEVRVVLPLAE
jgi:PAS domain S-box-containing protein